MSAKESNFQARVTENIRLANEAQAIQNRLDMERAQRIAARIRNGELTISAAYAEAFSIRQLWAQLLRQ